MMMIPIKLLQNEIWRTPLAWDDQFTNDLNNKWRKWVELMSNRNEIRNPPHYGICSSHRDNIEIHFMVNVSETAYFAVAYCQITLNAL